MNANIRVAVQALSRERNRIRLNADSRRRQTAPALPGRSNPQESAEPADMQVIERNIAALDVADGGVERLAVSTTPGEPAT